ncbi:MAG: bile acid:sodium symporter, partial [Candidatus Omnitrophica bacterium]|nr:bile acid:sodium symporter [Candidatus Omnitrophota bacterium]
AMIFLAVFLHNLLGLAGGYTAGGAYGFDKKRQRALSLEVGMQNAGLGAVLALKHFGAEVAIVPALFATWCVVTASILAEYWRKRP